MMTPEPPLPDPSQLVRVIAGENVFGLDTDSRIRRAANEMSALAMIELFKRCDPSRPEWCHEYAQGLSEFITGEPSALIGFDDGRSRGKVCLEEDLPEIPEAIHRYYLKLVFSNEEAAYYQFRLFPAMDEPFLAGGARQREGECQHVMIEVGRPGDLQLFINGLRKNPHLIAVEESSKEIFDDAPSHSV